MMKLKVLLLITLITLGFIIISLVHNGISLNFPQVSNQNTSYSFCAGYQIKKEEIGKNTPRWTIYEPHWLIFKKKVFKPSKEYVPGQINGVGCDTLALNDTRLRIDYYTGGAHCYSVSYWLKEGEKPLFISFQNNEGNVDEHYKADPQGNAIFQVDDASMTYFTFGKFEFPYSESFVLSLSICFKNSAFYDCTIAQSDLLERLRRVEEALNPSIRAPHPTSPRLLLMKVIEYVSLSLLANDNNYKLKLEEWGLANLLTNGLDSKIAEQLASRNQSYGKLPLTEVSSSINANPKY